MEETVHELKELRNKLIGKTIAQVSRHEIFFDDGTVLEFSASVFLPNDIEYIFKENENKD